MSNQQLSEHNTTCEACGKTTSWFGAVVVLVFDRRECESKMTALCAECYDKNPVIRKGSSSVRHDQDNTDSKGAS